jgi:AcrR family transcriptional regulator
MGALSMPSGDSSRRRYDSPARRQQAAETRERIIAAGAELVRGFSTWKWDELTFRVVAERAGVSERTVYRNFPSERQLHDAVMARLEDEAGVSYDGMSLDGIAEVATRVFAALHRFAIEDHGPAVDDPTFVGADERRREALMQAVSEQAPHWDVAQRRAVAGLIDVLWGIDTYERLVGTWKLDEAEASGAIAWLIGKVVEGVGGNDPPGRSTRS